MQSLNVILNYFLQTYFLRTRCVLFFSDSAIYFNFSYPIVRVMVDAEGNFDPHVAFSFFGCQGFLLHTRMPTVIIKRIESAIRYETMERFNTRRYIVLAEGEEKSEVKSQVIREVFSMHELEYIADFLLAVYSESKGLKTSLHQRLDDECRIEIFTHEFVGKFSSNEILHLASLNVENSIFHLHCTHKDCNFYPNKLRNGQGRQFTIATFTYKPYSIPEFRDGTELRIAIEFSQRHNLIPAYVIDEKGEWGEIYENWTGYGILGNVVNDKADLGLAALYTWAHEYTYLDLSKPVVRTGITCLTPAPHLASGWLVPLLSFTSEMWIGVGITFLVCPVILTIVDYFTQAKTGTHMLPTATLVEESLMDTAAIFLLQAFNRFGNAPVSKNFLYGCMVLFSLLIGSSYSSGLASGMTVPRYVGAISTVQDLVDSGIQWGATSIAWINSIVSAEEYNYKLLVDRFISTDDARLRKYNHKRLAFSIERLQGGQFAIGDYITEKGASKLKLMSEDLYWEHCVLMARKSSIWTPLIDGFILDLAQTGIPGVWEYQVATKYLNPKIQRTVQFSLHHTGGSNDPKKLNWGHVQGIFSILLIGNTFAMICFIAELLCYLYSNKTPS